MWISIISDLWVIIIGEKYLKSLKENGRQKPKIDFKNIFKRKKPFSRNFKKKNQELEELKQWKLDK